MHWEYGGEPTAQANEVTNGASPYCQEGSCGLQILAKWWLRARLQELHCVSNGISALAMELQQSSTELSMWFTIQWNVYKVTCKFCGLSRQVVFHGRENKYDFVKTLLGKWWNLCVFSKIFPVSLYRFHRTVVNWYSMFASSNLALVWLTVCYCSLTHWGLVMHICQWAGSFFFFFLNLKCIFQPNNRCNILIHSSIWCSLAHWSLNKMGIL